MYFRESDIYHCELTGLLLFFDNDFHILQNILTLSVLGIFYVCLQLSVLYLHSNVKVLVNRAFLGMPLLLVLRVLI